MPKTVSQRDLLGVSERHPAKGKRAPAFTEGAWTGQLAMEDCKCDCPRELYPSCSLSHEGAIPNAALKRPGRLRSCHPIHSWIANGYHARSFVQNHRYSPTPCGIGYPFERLLELGGCIVSLWGGVNTLMLWHYIPRRHFNCSVPGILP